LPKKLWLTLAKGGAGFLAGAVLWWALSGPYARLLASVSESLMRLELANGLAVAGGKVLRLRCYSRTFEFVLPNDVVARWHMMMPPRRAPVTAVA
jgi:hypothetical protein